MGVGLWIGIVILQLARTYHCKFLRPVAHHTLTFNFGLFLFSIFLYFELNLRRTLSSPPPPIYSEILIFLVTLCELALLYFMLSIGFGFKAKKSPLFLRRSARWGGMAFIVSYGFRIILRSQNHWAAFFKECHSSLFDNVMLLEIPILIWIFFSAARNPDKTVRKMGRTFALTYLGRYVGILSVAGAVVAFALPREIRHPLAIILFILINATPFLWIKFFFQPAAHLSLDLRNSKSRLDFLTEKHGISKREREIIELILEGRSNKEIENQLYISFHTVKNHISNIYQKLGIKSRYELIRMVTVQKDSISR